MANRSFKPGPQALEQKTVNLFARVTFGASGAPTLDTGKSQGIKSIARNSAGNYTITFSDMYSRMLAFQYFFLDASAPASPACYVTNDNSASSTPTAVIQFNAAGTATDPASGEEVRLMFAMKNSSI